MTDRAPALPQPGSTLAGRYLLGKRLGKGAMGVVFEGVLAELNQKVAIKVLRPEMLAEPEVVARFAREARLVAKLSSEHVVRVFDVDETEDGLPFIVMERLEGTDLARELAQYGPFTIERAIDHVRQICAGVAEAHRAGVIHRDLKPSNVFLITRANGAGPKREVLKIVDFGISKLLGDSQLTATNATFGTPKYMSPEQVRSAKAVDQRTDVWAIAVILYELLAGEPPFIGESAPAVAASIVVDEPRSLRSMRPDIPAWLEKLVMAGLAKNPSERIPTALAFRAALDGTSASTAAPAGSSRPPAPTADPIGSSTSENHPGLFADAKSVSTSPNAKESFYDSVVPSGRGSRRRLGFALLLCMLVASVSALGLGLFATSRARGSAVTATSAASTRAAPDIAMPSSSTAVASVVPEAHSVDARTNAAPSSRAQSSVIPRASAAGASAKATAAPQVMPSVATPPQKVCPESQKILVGSALVCP